MSEFNQVGRGRLGSLLDRRGPVDLNLLRTWLNEVPSSTRADPTVCSNCGCTGIRLTERQLKTLQTDPGGNSVRIFCRSCFGRSRQGAGGRPLVPATAKVYELIHEQGLTLRRALNLYYSENPEKRRVGQQRIKTEKQIGNNVSKLAKRKQCHCAFCVKKGEDKLKKA